MIVIMVFFLVGSLLFMLTAIFDDQSLNDSRKQANAILMAIWCVLLVMALKMISS
jgi:hypothetical protein